jgi:transposase-like protein
VPTEDSGQVDEMVEHKRSEIGYPARCPRCDSENLRRLRRKGFLQGKIYSKFGYYPWRCTKCFSDFLLKRRGSRRRHAEPQLVEL